jgi:hypothetical protein
VQTFIYIYRYIGRLHKIGESVQKIEEGGICVLSEFFAVGGIIPHIPLFCRFRGKSGTKNNFLPKNNIKIFFLKNKSIY